MSGQACTVAVPRAQLTRRGIAVVLGLFLALMVSAVAVVVTSFLAVSNAPLSGDALSPGIVAAASGGQ